MNVSCAEVMALIRLGVFLRLVAERSDRFLEQRINITFRVELRNSACDTYAMLSEAYRGEAMKKSSVLSGMNG
jgi:hypothetical protein